MKPSVSKRILSVVLVLCILFSLMPVFHTVEAKALSGIDSLTCADFISNSTARNYIDVMMRYYLNNNAKLRTTLDNGLSVIFMFEGGSDHYQEYGSTYANSAYDIRNQSVVIVVQKNAAGNPYVDFWAENCSSIPGDPSWCSGNAYEGSTTILDGIYPFYTTNHTGPYAALQLDMSATNGLAYYTPSWDPDGFTNGASGINVHTRAENIAAGSDLGYAWSEGCQVISSGSTYYDNYFNEFMQSVTGITWNPWIDYYAGNLNSFAYTGTHMGYYVVDRQLGLTNPSGTEYGSGSLIELYNETALENITEYSAEARAEAFANLFDQCTFFPSYCRIQPTHDSSINTLPCANGSNGSVTFEKADPNKLYTCTGVILNHAGNYWWELISSSGEVGYMYGESALYYDMLPSDVTVTGATSPNGHGKGNTFPITGTVSTSRFELSEVSVWVCSGFDQNGTKVTGYSIEPTGNAYNLAGSTIDNNTAFDQLPPGKYTYVIEAKYKNYVTKDNALWYYHLSTTLLSQYFLVVPNAVSQSSCTHSYVTSTMTAATCTAKGSAVVYCELCGKLTTEILPALGHSYVSQTTVAATCTTDGFLSRTCAACGYEEEKILPATGHRNALLMTDGTCIQQASYTYFCQTCKHIEPIDLKPYQSQWLETIPDGFGEGLFAIRNQYRTRTIGDPTWSEWEDGVALSYPDQEVQTRTLYRMKAMPFGDHSWSDGACIHCNTTCNHQYENKYCTICGYREPDDDLYLFGWINGANYACEEDADNTGAYKFVDGKLVVTFTQRSYVAVKTGDNRIWYMTDGYPGDDAISATLYSTQITAERSDKLSVPRGREITFTVIRNEDGTLTLRYVPAECEHDFLDGICQTCDEVCDHLIWTHGACGSCGLVCEHEHWTDGVCDHCTLKCSHLYSDNHCTVCGHEKPPMVYYLFGYINGRDYGCESDYLTMGDYRFMDGTLTVVFDQDSYVAVKTGDNQDWYMADRWLGMEATEATLYNTDSGAYEKLFVPAGKVVTFFLTDNGDDTLTLSYIAEDCLHESHNTLGLCDVCGKEVEHHWKEEVTEATCTTAGIIIRTCTVCGKGQYKNLPATGHRTESAVTSPTCSIPGYTTHTCTVCGYSYSDTQVPPKGHTDELLDSVAPSCTAAGTGQYRCSVCGYRYTKEILPTGHRYDEIVTAPTCTKEGFTTYVCSCGDTYVGSTTAIVDHRYENGKCVYCGEIAPNVIVPTLTLKSPNLEFKDTICINAFYTAENIQDVVEMGMITYRSKVTSVSVDTAEHIIPGATYVEASGRYYSSSQSIHAKYLGDPVYLSIYARLRDGSYAYSKLASYSAIQYANSQLKNSTDTKLKQLVVAMLNYGAEAQRYFGHNEGSLANAALTADQKALSEPYRADMAGSVPTASAAKQGIFANNQGFASRKPAISFEGAFCINYFFTPKYAPSSGITLYYWTEADFSAAEVLTPSNATGKFKLEGSGTGEYRGDITGIAAKALSEAVYVAAAYKDSNGTVWTSGVLGYSIGTYCGSQASKDTDFSALAMATAVYGYHARQYFGS